MEEHAESNPNEETKTPTRENPFLCEKPVLPRDHRVMRAFQAAVEAYNHENWDAAISLSGKVLENIARTELSFSEQSGGLGQLMEKLIKQVKTEQPLIELAAGLKDGQGLASYFNLERESDRQIAQLTLDLIECFINYLYVFRQRIEQLMTLAHELGNERDARRAESEGEHSTPYFTHGRAAGEDDDFDDDWRHHHRDKEKKQEPEAVAAQMY